MTVGEIIKAVRFCFDEEAQNDAEFANAAGNDNKLMDNIIEAKIGDAFRWLCFYAPAELLGGTDETKKNEQGKEEPVETGVLVDIDNATVTAITEQDAGRLDMPSDFIRLARVRVDGWHRAVASPIEEDSDEYLQLYDTNGATATNDRPQAAIINRATKQIEVWPWDNTRNCSFTYVAAIKGNPFEEETSSESGQTVTVTHYPIPPRVTTAFIYYIAFLVLSAYEDSRSGRMLEIAKMSLGINN